MQLPVNQTQDWTWIYIHLSAACPWNIFFAWLLLLLLFSCSVMSKSLWPHELQHVRPPCPSPSPGICPSSCPLSWWYHPTISSFAALFSLCLQSFPESGCFPVSQPLASGDQNIGASASASVLAVDIQGWFPLGLTGLISLLSRVLSRVFSSTTVGKHQFFSTQPSLWSTSHTGEFYMRVLHDYWKDHMAVALTTQTFINKVMSLFFNTLSRFVIAFLPRSKHLDFYSPRLSSSAPAISSYASFLVLLLPIQTSQDLVQNLLFFCLCSV